MRKLYSLLLLLAVTLTAAASKVHTVNNMEEFQAAVEAAEDGDVIKFREGLRGQVIDNREYADEPFDVQKSLTIIGSGVVIEGGKGFFLGAGHTLVWRDLVFHKVDSPIQSDYNNLTVENCIFDECSGMWASGVSVHVTVPDVECNVLISNCRFSNAKGVKALRVTEYPDATAEAHMTAKVVSCTFVDCLSSGMEIYNAYDIAFANNVIQNCGGDVFWAEAGEEDGARCYSLGYNVIVGEIDPDVEELLVSTDKFGDDLSDAVVLADGEYQVLKDGPAYQNVPAGTVIEGLEWPEKDITGMVIDATAAMHSGACQQVGGAEDDVDYTQGVFILNEDWYGHQNSTINFLTADGEWVYRAVQRENEGVKLGCTAQYGTIYGDRLYIMSKQAKDPGDPVVGGRLNIFDAKTLKLVRQYESIGTTKQGVELDGRGFLGVSEKKAYVGTNSGIRVLDLETLEFTGSVSGSESDDESGSYATYYDAQVGTMARVNDYVFAVHQRLGLLVINPETDKIERVITTPDGNLFSSVVVGHDGNLWLSIGTSAVEPQLGRLDPNTLELTVIDLTEGTYGPANSWYAWTPDGFCASRQQNVLYWNGGSNSWFTGQTIYRYDIDTNECTLFIDHTKDPDGWQQYGCSFRVDPVTDEIYTSLFKSYGDPTYVLRKYSPEGVVVAEYPMIADYWFPSLPIFPDNEEPQADTFGDVQMGAEPRTLPLADACTDADNFDLAIVKTVKSVSDESVLTAEVKGGELVITPLADGTAVITIQFNSNGKLADATVSVTVTGATAIGQTQSGSQPFAVGMTDLSGASVTAGHAGQIVIQRMSDGTSQKVVLK